MNHKLKKELLDMVEEDNRVRTELIASGELFQGYNSRMADFPVLVKAAKVIVDIILKGKIRDWYG